MTYWDISTHHSGFNVYGESLKYIEILNPASTGQGPRLGTATISIVAPVDQW